MARVIADTSVTKSKRGAPLRAAAKRAPPADAGSVGGVREASPEARRAALDELTRISEELCLYEWERQHADEWVKQFQSEPNVPTLDIKR
jgi:hypothetical protein